MAQLAHNLTHDIVVGHTDTHGLLVALKQFGHIVVGVQDKGEGAGQHLLHYLEDMVGNGAGVVGKIAQVVTDESHRTLLLPVAEQGSDALDGLGLEDIAPDAIDGVGRIDDDASVLKALHDLINGALVWILGIDFQ